MGYRTQYRLTVEPAQLEYAVREDLSQRAYRGTSPFAEDGCWGTPDGECKWYTHKEDALACSKEFPTARITINGQGEDDDDDWCRVYLGGKLLPL